MYSYVSPPVIATGMREVAEQSHKSCSFLTTSHCQLWRVFFFKLNFYCFPICHNKQRVHNISIKRGKKHNMSRKGISTEIILHLRHFVTPQRFASSKFDLIIEHMLHFITVYSYIYCPQVKSACGIANIISLSLSHPMAENSLFVVKSNMSYQKTQNQNQSIISLR